MAGEGRFAALADRIERLRVELEQNAPDLDARRIAIRDEIVALSREIDQGLAELTELKEQVGPIAESYRTMFTRPAPGPATSTVRIDHLGSSTYRERGWSALAGADYERAIRELNRALELDPTSAASRTYLAWAHLRLQEWDRARPLLDGVLSEDPEHPLARTCIGYLHLRENNYAEAIESLSVVARDGTDATATLYANLYLGIVYAERDMHRDAQSFFRRALELGPNLVEAYWELGRSHQREGREELAIEAWRAGAENRYNPWAERCRVAAERLEAQRGMRRG